MIFTMLLSKLTEMESVIIEIRKNMQNDCGVKL